MKTTILTLACALVVSGAFAGETIEKTTTTTTTTGDGTIETYEPGTTFIVKESSGPVTYRYGDKVTYVTKHGKVLTAEDVKTRIKVGIPVHVHYDKDGDKRVIRKIEVDDD